MSQDDDAQDGVWLRLEDDTDDQALFVPTREHDTVAQLIVAATDYLDLGNARPGQLQLVKDDTVISNQAPVEGLFTPKQVGVIKFRKARALVAEARTEPDSSALAEFFRKQELRQAEPWRLTADRLAIERNAAYDRSAEEAQNVYVGLARNGMLTPMQALVGGYVLFATRAEVRFFVENLLRKGEQQMLLAHNFLIAEKHDPSFASQYGNQLLGFQWPLFPHDERFRALNQKMLAEGAGDVSGGGGKGMRPSVFRQEVAGGGYLPVQTSPQGPLVDVTPIETAFGQMQQQLAELKQQMQPPRERRYDSRYEPAHPRDGAVRRQGRGRFPQPRRGPRGGDEGAAPPPPPAGF